MKMKTEKPFCVVCPEHGSIWVPTKGTQIAIYPICQDGSLFSDEIETELEG
jgi:hypothetical protein